MKKIFLIALVFLFIQTPSFAKTILTIATAANFVTPLEKISALYEKENQDIDIKITSGASGVLAGQISSGAPYDIFFSADKKNIDFLEKKNNILQNSSFNFAIGKLILWMPKNIIHNLSEQEIKKLLLTMKTPIAVADASIAPFGFATEEYLKNSYANKETKPKNFVYGRNIEQTANFVSTGSSQCGFISLSTVIEKVDKKEYWIVPSSKYSPIVQRAGIVKQSKQIKSSEKFIHFFKTSAEVKKIIIGSGYSLDFDNI